MLRAVNDTQVLQATVAKMADNLFARSACANDQPPMSIKAAENLLREFHPRERYGHGQSANRRFRSHAFAEFEGALKQAIENLSAGAPFEAISVSHTHLPQNFPFAHH